MVSGLLSIDLVILLTWQLSDPLQRRLESFPLEDPILTSDDIKIRPELEHCESENQSIWLGECRPGGLSAMRLDGVDFGAWVCD